MLGSNFDYVSDTERIEKQSRFKLNNFLFFKSRMFMMKNGLGTMTSV